MIPWDFGIINAIRKKIELSIFPPDPPKEFRKTPYLIFELKNIAQGTNLQFLVEFVLTIVDNQEIHGESFNILRNINKIISKELTLCQGKSIIGSAKIKMDSIESKKNCLIVNLAAILQLKTISGETQ